MSQRAGCIRLQPLCRTLWLLRTHRTFEDIDDLLQRSCEDLHRKALDTMRLVMQFSTPEPHAIDNSPFGFQHKIDEQTGLPNASPEWLPIVLEIQHPHSVIVSQCFVVIGAVDKSDVSPRLQPLF